METLAILKALLKWEDKLIRQKFTVVTDHKALEFFSKQQKLSGRQARWAEYLSRFDFEIMYVKGRENVVADCLSQYYKSNTPEDKHPSYVYVSADAQLDPDGKDLPFEYDPHLHAAHMDFNKPTFIPRPSPLIPEAEDTPNVAKMMGTESIHLPRVMNNT